MTAYSPTDFASVSDIKGIDSKGPWETKSGGALSVLFNIPLDILRSTFFNYDEKELALIPEDVRGIRSYKVDNIPKHAIGANEWHKLRHELVFIIKGSVRWTCEDIQGNKLVSNLHPGKGIWVQPYILHTYESLSDSACLLVIANTLFMPDKPETHDTYSAALFTELQESVLTCTK
jgi:hypothetical protein